MSIKKIEVRSVGPVAVPAWPTGPRGPRGWTPTLLSLEVGTRKLVQVTGWTGGFGTVPATGYLGPNGLTDDVAEATDFAPRGLLSVEQDESANLVLHYNDGTTQTIPAYFADVLAKAQDVAERHENIISRQDDITAKHEEVGNDTISVTLSRQDVENRQANVIERQTDIVTRQEDITTKHQEVDNDAIAVEMSRAQVQGWLNAASVNGTTRITPRQMGFSFGKNLFNKLAPDVQLGFYVTSTSGNLTASGAHNATGFIPVTAGQTYAISAKNQIAWFDANKVYISGTSAVDTNQIQTAPTGAAFLRCTVSLVYWDTFQVEQGSVVTPFETFRIYIDQIESANVYVKRVEGLTLTGRDLGYSVGKNLFNPADAGVQLGYYVLYSSGNAGPNAAYNATGYIPVTAGQTYALSYKHQIAWYGANKVYISGSHSSDPSRIQTAPAGAAFLRCSVNSSAWDVFQVEAGSAVTSYEAYSYYLDTIDGLKVYAKNVASAPSAAAQVSASVAPKLYVARGRELSVYYENVHRNYESEARGLVEATLTPVIASEVASRSRRLRFKQSGSNNSLISIPASLKIYDREIQLLSTIAFQIQPVDETKSGALKILNIGDSFTGRMSMANKLLQSGVGGNVTFLGMRKAYTNASWIRHEGRGGFTSSSYHTNSTTTFMPFMQPTSAYKYYGNSDFWKLVFTSGNADYIAGSMNDDVLAYYNSVTGYLNAPATNDVIYDNTAAAYKRWDGSAWVTVMGLTWSFNIPKYLTLYGYAAPDVIHFMHGTNDFAGVLPSDMEAAYASYKTRMDTAIASAKLANPDVKFIVAVPVSSGQQGEYGTVTTRRRKLAFWRLAKGIHTDYGNREGENIYVVDYHSTVDRRTGYNVQRELPYDRYTGTERDTYTTDDVHLQDGFEQMGDMYFSIVQVCR